MSPIVAADWTLLITSGEHGDKLPIGFRGCHQAVDPAALVSLAEPSCELRVVASLPNEMSARVLRRPGPECGCLHRRCGTCSTASFPSHDSRRRSMSSAAIASSGRRSKTASRCAWQLSILVVTDGPRGSTVSYTSPSGDPGMLEVAAFPRSHPPRDTNRAGEAYAATFVGSLLDQGWQAGPGVVEDEMVRAAARRAAAAAALVLDRVEFGFPSANEIDERGAGRV